MQCTSSLRSSVQLRATRPSAGASRPASRMVVVCQAQATSSAESLKAKTEEVKKILAKEHEHHGQGKVLFLNSDGAGKRMFVGTSVVHIGNLSGQAVQSVDYSMFG